MCRRCTPPGGGQVQDPVTISCHAAAKSPLANFGRARVKQGPPPSTAQRCCRRKKFPAGGQRRAGVAGTATGRRRLWGTDPVRGQSLERSIVVITVASGSVPNFSPLRCRLSAGGEERYLPATARTALGFVLAIANSVRAAPLGCLRPCSQPCSVRTDTPSSAANCDCDRPVFLRASITGEVTTCS